MARSCAATGAGAGASRAAAGGAARACLPRVALSSVDQRPAPIWPSCSRRRVQDVWLEIGFGGGEHLLWQARANPDVGLIGCEPFEDGVVKVLSAIERSGIANIRLHADDARAAAALAARCQHRPRVHPVSRPLAQEAAPQAPAGIRGNRWRELGRVMRPGAELRIATDIGDYARWILLARAAQDGFRWTGRGAARTGASAPPTGRRPATSRRPSATAGAAATISAFGAIY